MHLTAFLTQSPHSYKQKHGLIYHNITTLMLPNSVLVKISIIVQKYHNSDRSSKKKYLIADGLLFQTFSVLLSQQEVWQCAVRHIARKGPESSTSEFSVNSKRLIHTTQICNSENSKPTLSGTPYFSNATTPKRPHLSSGSP